VEDGIDVRGQTGESGGIEQVGAPGSAPGGAHRETPAIAYETGDGVSVTHKSAEEMETDEAARTRQENVHRHDCTSYRGFSPNRRP
jgi:hypothetical protein